MSSLKDLASTPQSCVLSSKGTYYVICTKKSSIDAKSTPLSYFEITNLEKMAEVKLLSLVCPVLCLEVPLYYTNVMYM